MIIAPFRSLGSKLAKQHECTDDSLLIMPLLEQVKRKVTWRTYAEANRAEVAAASVRLTYGSD